VAGRANWHGLDEGAANGAIKLGPRTIGRPASVTGQTATLGAGGGSRSAGYIGYNSQRQESQGEKRLHIDGAQLGLAWLGLAVDWLKNERDELHKEDDSKEMEGILLFIEQLSVLYAPVS
jgi:hypothetical protein